MSFSERFWSHDYHSGYETLFNELYEGIRENNDFIQMFTKRMDAEHSYGSHLTGLDVSVKRSSKRHTDNDYVSTIKNGYQKLTENFAKQGSLHLEIAGNIKVLVLDPFSKWCAEHEQRVDYSESTISEKYKSFRSARNNLEKLQKKYFNKCRMLEEFKSHYSEEELEEQLEEAQNVSFSESSVPEEEEEDEESYVFDNKVCDRKDAKVVLSSILSNIELKSHKVPILGTYHNVSTGSKITQWVLDNMEDYKGSIDRAEQFGQDLLDNGFIRLIGSMSANKNFINSSQFFYQWKPVVFEITKLSEFDLSKSSKSAEYDPISASSSRANHFADYFDDVKQAMGVTSIDYNDKTQYAKLVKEVDSLDLQYFQTTKELDKIRCSFEEIVMDHLTFMHKCELDRMKAIKKVMFDFVSTFSNRVSSMKQVSEEMFVVEETINPVNDLKFLIENYATGRFDPKVTLYDNYYNSNIKQTFGVDLNVKARLDRKAVPLLVQGILSCLDSVYPELKDDDERTNLWTHPVHLSKVHKVRFQLNELSDLTAIQNVLKATDPIIITNVFKLYFLELPDSIIPHSYFDLIKTLYSSYPVGSSDEDTDSTRVNGLQNTLSELPVSNLATLDAILTHFNRLVNIIGSKNKDLGSKLRGRLCKEFGSLLLRPKDEEDGLSDSRILHSAATETLQQHFIEDLFQHKDTIFGELRRRNSNKSVSRDGPKSSRSEELTPKASVVASSKSRLESRLKRAVSKASHENEEEEDKENVSADPTEPPKTPTKSTSGLKRSTSPNKKKLNTLLTEKSSNASKSKKKEKLQRTQSSDSSEFASAASETGSGRQSLSKDEDETPPIVPPKTRSPKKNSDDVIVVE
ncbi:uncharacterized protein CXQ87_003625 [Candidozyma duobushaemuli]|uniref:Rho-GAP domain-containing protein n=2 Tax=Candidozyma TaxID=3303203 RepID=A0ABX8I8T8_9ASCO|nr:uncharacterized protein CXQ87_003625 [[Candida] duobushaemulonis]PVH15771.1 hypothetical protein CXQ87_003625 [[Candida] duobushaemulonis]QWU89519.1 hypothetical protein CA3LBN_003842 [[Candida] haemuloni]